MSAQPAPTYIARSAEPRHERDKVIAIWHGNLGREGHLESKFDWFYLACPWGTPLLQVLDHVPTATSVGVAAAGPRRMLRDGHEIAAAVLVDMAVMPEHRSLGPALMLQQGLIAAADTQFDLLYGFPNPKAAPVFKRVGYAALTVIERNARVLRHARYVARSLPPVLASVAGAAVDLGAWLRDRLRASGDPGLRSEWRDSVDPRIDELWQRTQPVAGTMAIRDCAFLAWRFDRAPLGKTRYLLLSDNAGQLQAWFACQVHDQVLHVCDFWSVDALSGLARRFVDALLSAARRERHAAVSMGLAGPASRLAGWRACGFSVRGQRPVFGRLRGGSALADIATQLHLTSADEDE